MDRPPAGASSVRRCSPLPPRPRACTSQAAAVCPASSLDRDEHKGQAMRLGPFLVVCAATALIAIATYRYCRRGPAVERDPCRALFRTPEMRLLDAELDKATADELERLVQDVARFLAGEVGHIVVISDTARGGLVLQLSDGCLMTLIGVGQVPRGELLKRAAKDKLRPARLERNTVSCRLLLRGESGYEMRLHTRRVLLTQ